MLVFFSMKHLKWVHLRGPFDAESLFMIFLDMTMYTNIFHLQFFSQTSFQTHKLSSANHFIFLAYFAPFPSCFPRLCSLFILGAIIKMWTVWCTNGESQCGKINQLTLQCCQPALCLSNLFFSSFPWRHLCVRPCVHTCTPTPIARLWLEASIILWKAHSISSAFSLSLACKSKNASWECVHSYTFPDRFNTKLVTLFACYTLFKAAGGITEKIRVLFHWGMTHSPQKLQIFRTTRNHMPLVNEGKPKKGRNARNEKWKQEHEKRACDEWQHLKW